MKFSSLNPTMDKLFECFKLDVAYVKGEGVYLYDQAGNKYLDFIAQYGAVPFGYNPPEIVAAAQKYFDLSLPSMVQPSIPIKAVELAEMLLQLAPGKMAQATFCQSGAEAVEVAIKLARSTTGKPKILSTKNSFHGKTMGALSATGRDVYQKPFFTPVPGFEHIPFGDLDMLENKMRSEGKQIAAFLVEPIQGEGGIIVPPEGYLKNAEIICRKYGVLLVVDEVQTGLGRTGELFACDREGVEPDILLLSKALGGGLVPLGVCLSNKQAWNKEFGRLHSSTFANNNFTCAIGLAVLNKLLENDRQLIKNAKKAGNYLLKNLENTNRQYPGVIKEIRGRGLMLGLEFNGFDGSESFSMKYLAEQGGFSPLLAGYLLNIHKIRVAPFLNNPMTMRLQPSLTIAADEINTALHGLEQVVKALYYQDHCELYSYIIGKEPGPIRDFRSERKAVKGSELLPEEKPTEKFAFLIHYPSSEDVIKNNPSFKKASKDNLEKLLDWEASLDAEPDVVVHLPAFKSKAGKIAEGWLIGIPYSGRHLMEMPRKDALKVLNAALDKAKALGAGIVGLGAFTSVVSRGGSDLQGKGIAVTSGNSYTIATAFDALIEGARLMGIDPAESTGCIIGATGSIGRVCAILLAEEVDKLILVGNPEKEKTSLRRMEQLADELYTRAFREILAYKGKVAKIKGIAKWLKGFLDRKRKDDPEVWNKLLTALENQGFSINGYIHENLAAKGKYSNPPVKITVNIKQALLQSDLIISASNSTNHLIGPGHLKPGSVICDVARPPDVSEAVLEQRKDVLVIEGGLVQYPDDICFGQNMGYEPGVNLACLSETMLLALEGTYKDFSIGLTIPVENVYYLRELAQRHGFKLATPWNKNGGVTPEVARMIKEAALKNDNVEKIKTPKSS
ncbi:aminotransferase class III-fold pyridoxal phosphate-dependent enzyme [Thermincola potens]|uniref:Aminotransferase class-III n=1 Tax=Thermincola potens (strain JR) TaxID=635013 RepID=D5XF86_THEPJ|nr:aminotransferase class III-fold pyridoxal phosphate-dependent enzyme [Thermincola potens]ADG82307.1 aminotransferase class-III [Thermincola potens JR]